MTTFIIIIVLLMGLRYVHGLLPVKGVNTVDISALKSSETSEMKWVDVRDADYYEQCHAQGSINISIGRLPFVWKQELSQEEPILIIADSSWKRRKAARILKRKGFRQINTLRGEICSG